MTKAERDKELSELQSKINELAMHFGSPLTPELGEFIIHSQELIHHLISHIKPDDMRNCGKCQRYIFE